jgi:hypothetical protein
MEAKMRNGLPTWMLAVLIGFGTGTLLTGSAQLGLGVGLLTPLISWLVIELPSRWADARKQRTLAEVGLLRG